MFLIGKKSSEKLKKIGITTIGKLANTDIEIIKLHLKSNGEKLYNYAHGQDLDESYEHREIQKSISHSKTSIYDLTDINNIYTFILDITNSVCKTLRDEKMKTKNITVTLKTSNFEVYSKSETLKSPTNVTLEIFNICKRLFNSMYRGEAIRLIGISLSSLDIDDTLQLNLFDNLLDKQHNVDIAVDKLLNKYKDNNLLTRASLIKVKKKEN